MFTCIFLDKIDSNTENLIRAAVPKNIQIFFWSKLSTIQQEEYIKRADALLTATYIVDAALMKQAIKLKTVQKTGVGTDNIDKAAAKKLGIIVDNVPGGNAESVAELTIAFILDIYRHIIPLETMSQTRQWGMWQYRDTSFDIKGKTYGIIGFGNIGKRTAQLANAFGANVIYYNRTRQTDDIENTYAVTYAPLNKLLQTSDIVSIHLPLTKQTTNFIDTDQLKLMKDTAVLVNVGRGGVINETALYTEMKNGRFLGAGIDVWSKEPFDAANQLLELPNVIATPHIGAGTQDAMRNVYHICFEKIIQNCTDIL
ncbi:phosphoglycerate dehydrogenase [Pectinatus frisingensis]|uniref:phosphoglycerate dehydrogenase n=1 Tax=Pectinatus frisingensis TaxID=865 RepID=UPI0018C6D74D